MDNMDKDWGNDLEVDGDCVDGCPAYNTHMVSRNFQNNFTKYQHHNSREISSFFEMKRGDPFLKNNEFCDSGCLIEQSERHDSANGIDAGNIDNDFESIHELASVSEGITKLTLNNSESEKTCLEERCESEGYFSEERKSSGYNPTYPTCIFEHLNTQDDDGDTPLHCALIQEEHDWFINILQSLVQISLLNIQNNLQQTVLHLAVVLKLPHIVRRLVAKGAKVDLRDRNGNTPLHIACKNADYDCVLALTTPLEEREVQNTVYMAYQRVPQAQNILNYEGLTCLHLAASSGNLNIINHLLVKCNADINAKDGRSGATILHMAIECNKENLVKFLLQFLDVDVNATRFDGNTALALARGYHNKRLEKILEKSGAIISVTETDVLEMDCANSYNDFSYDDFKIDGSYVR